jgi:CDP-diacylglycerol--glycerol-3-phosphate 3-phosphatidyltransferase
MVINFPTQITILRLIVSLLVFIWIPLRQFQWALWAFLLAAGTDWLDGYLARRNQLVTQLGRILDPFADKILICGAFILLGAEPGSRVEAWMAVVVVGRELLVTALRSFLEQRGSDFSANMSGKLKMVFQCLAVTLSLCLLSWGPTSVPPWLDRLTWTAVWLAVISTVYSGIGYVFTAASLMRETHN